MIYRLFAVVLLVAATASAAEACKCREKPPAKEALVQSDAVFLGKVTSVTEMGNEIVATFEVMQSWKGVKESKIIVQSGTHSCGFRFEMGKEYVVYGYNSEGKLSTNLCTRTRSFDGKDKSEIEALGEPEKMPPSPEAEKQ